MLVVLRNCLRADALEWWQGVSTNFLNYNAFKIGVRARFGESEAVLMQKILHIKQGDTETVCHYVDRFRLLVYNTGYPEAGHTKPICRSAECNFQGSPAHPHQNRR